jgi:hypothetical protein
MTIDKDSRYTHAQIRSSGFGFVTFDKTDRTINIEAYRFKADVDDPNPVRDQFSGWPLKISQFDNLGQGANNVLPEITVNKANQLIQIENEKTGELANIYRMNGNKIQPRLFEKGTFTIKIGEGENSKTMKGVTSQLHENKNTLSVEL